MNVIQKLAEHFNDELQCLEEAIQDALDHDVQMIKDILHHIVYAGGKRFRPLLLITSAALVGGKNLKKTVQIGAAIELIHTATLLHDDVVDENNLRRGKTTANKIWGNSYAVLSGDYLFTTAFHLLIQNKNIEILDISTKTAMAIAEGEVLQMMNIKNFDLHQETSIKIIKAKTAQLISAACHIGAIIGEGSYDQKEALEKYGECLGMLFQITDDILDYTGDAHKLGKPIGSDFWEGKMTLPLLYAWKEASQERRDHLKLIMESQDKAQFKEVQKFINDYRGIEKTMNFAADVQHKAIDALSIFSDGKMRKLLEELTQYCLVRSV